MDYLPLFVRIAQRPCVLVGGGQVALRKARLMVRAGANLMVIAPAIEAELRELVEAHAGGLHERAFADADLDALDIALVVAATDDQAVNAQVQRAARARRLWVNVVDSVLLSDAVFPSIIDRTPVLIALGSGGQSPVLLRLWRERLEALLPARLGELSALAGRFRTRVAQAMPHGNARRRFWERILQGSVAERALAGDLVEAERDLQAAIDCARPDVRGEVFIVGAGPGAADLLTLRALQLMQRADIVLHDQLVSPAVLDLVRRDAVRIAVGKRGRAGGEAQARIHALMIEHVRAGARVLRLKGGDPLLFGRLGEEVDALIAAAVPFQIVPGITAATGCAAIAGIPLTERTLAQSVRFVTAQRGGGEPNLDWPELARAGQTLVVYMGGARMDEIFAQLRAHGRADATPVAVIESGTLPEQRIQITDLGLSRSVAPAGGGPMLLIIGEVVDFHQRSVAATAKS